MSKGPRSFYDATDSREIRVPIRARMQLPSSELVKLLSRGAKQSIFVTREQFRRGSRMWQPFSYKMPRLTTLVGLLNLRVNWKASRFSVSDLWSP